MSSKNDNLFVHDHHAPSSYLAMLILAILLGLGIWLFINNDTFRDDAILTPLASPSSEPAVAGFSTD